MFASGVLQTPRHMPMIVSSSGTYNKANIFLGLIEYELNSLLNSHLVDYISLHIRFNLESYLLIIWSSIKFVDYQLKV